MQKNFQNHKKFFLNFWKFLQIFFEIFWFFSVRKFLEFLQLKRLRNFLKSSDRNFWNFLENFLKFLENFWKNKKKWKKNIFLHFLEIFFSKNFFWVFSENFFGDFFVVKSLKDFLKRAGPENSGKNWEKNSKKSGFFLHFFFTFLKK